MYASPQTHQRFLRRHRGTYGPALPAGGSLFGFLPLPEVPQPGVLSPIPKLLRCGDSVFPGVGVPAVAASGAIAASTLAPLPKHLGLMWDVSQTQNTFWRECGGKEKWLASAPAPFRPAAGGGAEFMTPDQYYKPKPEAEKSFAEIGKRGVVAQSHERVVADRESR